MIDETPEAPSLPTTPEQAFDQAQQGYTLFGAPLHSYSDSRRIAAQSLGFRWAARTQEMLDQMRSLGIYDGGQRDTLLLLWLCSIPNASELTPDDLKSAAQRGERPWTVQRAQLIPAAAEEAMMAWGAQQELIDLQGERFAEAFKVFLAIVLGVAVSEFDVQAPAGAAPEKDAPDPNA